MLLDHLLILEDDVDFAEFFKLNLKVVFPNMHISHLKYPTDVYNSELLRVRVKYIFFDIYFFEENKLALIPDLLNHFFNAQLVIISASENFNDLICSFELGAIGYILKTFNEHKLLSFLEIVKSGESIISPTIASKLVKRLQIRSKSSTLSDFSSIEEKTLSILALGKSYEESAIMLGVSINGLRSRIRKIYTKLRVSNRVAAIEAYYERKLSKDN